MSKTAIEVITSVQRRRRWSAEEKERLVAASLEPGTGVSAVARQAGIERSRCRGIEVVAAMGAPATSSSVAGGLGMNSPVRPVPRGWRPTISNIQGTIAWGLSAIVALVWPLWLESRCQASNVEVVAGDLFATRNLLKSHAERSLLCPYSNIRAITSKLCARSSLAIVEDHRL